MNNPSLLKKQQIPEKLITRDKKINTQIQNHFYKNKVKEQRNRISALMHNFKPGYMEAQQGQQTLKIKQSEIKEVVNTQTASSIFDLNLNMGTYQCEFAANGSTLLLTSSMGHTSLIDWRQKQALLEINLQQNIRKAKFLHNDEMFALCQPNNAFIYDNKGIELHKLDRSLGVQYLPYHFLLVTYDQRKLRYYDTTTGHIIADHVAKNPYTVMRQNHSNAIIALGSAKGTVEWWTPGVGTPAIKLFVGAAVDDIGFYKNYMYTASEDIKIWDTRMLKVVQTYPLHRKIVSLQISQSGLMNVNYGFKLNIYKDSHLEKQTHPYMTYKPNGTIQNCKFVPFEDILGLGTNYGYSSIAVPGSGVPFYDSFQNNPFETKKQKRQGLVHKLLQKIAPQTITIDPNIIGNIDKTKREVLEKEEKEKVEEEEKKAMEKRLKKKKMRGKGKIKNRLNRKNIEVEKKKRIQLTKNINTKLWAKWAQKKKKEKEMKIIQEMKQNGFSVAELSKKKLIRKH